MALERPEIPESGRVAAASRGEVPAAKLFVNRELSFLEFNQRIVEEAADPEVPLLERLKFISIVSANLDEFFMVRVGGLKQQLKSGVLETGPDGMLPGEQLSAISARVATQIEDQERILFDDLIPALKRAGIHLLRTTELDPRVRAEVKVRFEREIFPMLTPLAVDPGHPFPLIKNRTLNLAVHLLPENTQEAFPLMALVQVPSIVPRFLEVDLPGDLAVVFIEDVIAEHVGSLFPGMRILECVPFRVLRNWDLSTDMEEQEDLLEAVQKELQRRARLDAVRLKIGLGATAELEDALRSALNLLPQDVERHRGPMALADLSQLLTRVGRTDLRDEAFQPVLTNELREAEDLFAEIARADILLHHPYESYEPVVDLLAQAAEDPAVLAIKQSLYRTNRDSPLVQSLITAAENGKQVTALLELKARFDEETNLVWARALEEAGVHVVYGIIGLKTHCKVTLVVRREASGIRRYVHLGTGNYNEQTAAIYSDLSYFTAREDVASDISSLFNLLTGYSDPPAWRRLIVAPMDLRARLLEYIDRTRNAAKKGGKAKIVLKTNALIDAQVIRALSKASQSGVDVTLLVRGPCAMGVGIPGISDKIVVRLLVDRAEGGCTGGKLIESINFRHTSNEVGSTIGQVDPNLQPTKKHEMTLGLDRELSSVMSLGVRYVHKAWDQTIDDIGVCVPGSQVCGEVYNIGNPGYGIGKTPIGTPGQYPSVPKVLNKYDGVEVVLRKRYSHNWQATTSVLLSRAYGNYGGLASSDEAGRSSPNVSRYYDSLFLSFDQKGQEVNGLLNTDRPVQFKLQGAYTTPWGTNLGLNFFAQTGLIQSSTVTYQGVPIYYNGRGDLGRTPMLNQTDLVVTHDFKIKGTTKLGLQANITNVFDQDTVTSLAFAAYRDALVIPNFANRPADAFFQPGGFDTVALQAARLPASGRPDPKYKLPNAYQGARAIRVMARISF